MPEMVQVGNEINPALLQKSAEPKGQDHVAAAGSKIQPRILLQIAQPEKVETWFAAATRAGVIDYDLIGISYYGHQWSSYDIA
jgi:arabinogalactan endo-1,4-beta-galactosidase